MAIDMKEKWMIRTTERDKEFTTTKTIKISRKDMKEVGKMTKKTEEE